MTIVFFPAWSTTGITKTIKDIATFACYVTCFGAITSKISIWAGIYFHFTKFVICIGGIPSRVRWMRSIVVIDYNSTANIPWTSYINGVRYCCLCVVAVLKAKYSICFVGCVRYKNREPKKSRGHTVEQTPFFIVCSVLYKDVVNLIHFSEIYFPFRCRFSIPGNCTLITQF